VSLTVRELAGEDRERWERFVAASENGTLFHRLRFLDYHPEGRFAFRHLVLCDGDDWVAVLPGALVDGPGAAPEEAGTGARELRSPAGASFGGPVFAPRPSEERAREVMGAVVAHARSAGWRRVLLGPPPDVYWNEGEPSILARALEGAGFRAAVRDVTQIIPLDGSEEEQFGRLDRAARKAVRRARRQGIEVAPSREWGPFHRLLVENRGRHGVVPTHTREELERLDVLVGEELALLAATREGRLHGGLLLMRANARVVLNFYLCHDEESQGDRPADLLVWESILWARRQGLSHYDFGTTSVDGVLNEGLWRFKGKFGAVDHPRTRWVLDLQIGVR
jgi:hypothetical protein